MFESAIYKNLHILFRGIYRPDRECVFCKGFCENKCAIGAIENFMVFQNDEFMFTIEPTEEKIFFSSFRKFLDLLNEHKGEQKKYMIFAFATYLDLPCSLSFIINYKSVIELAKELSRIRIECIDLNERNPQNILRDTPFLEIIDHILFYLENGGDDIKTPV